MSRREDSDFLGRWSARKLRTRDGRPGSEPTSERPLEQPPADVPADAPGKTDEEILRELGLPDPDGLVKGDDFKAFLKSAVPARIRRRALRRLWLSDPVLANLDGLNDYDQDFTDAATVVKDLKTAYSVTRGFLREAPAETAAAEQTEQTDPAAEGAEADGGEAGTDAAAEAPAERPADYDAAGRPAEADEPADPAVGHPPEEVAAGLQAADAPQPDAAAPRPSRMRFRFGTG